MLLFGIALFIVVLLLWCLPGVLCDLLFLDSTCLCGFCCLAVVFGFWVFDYGFEFWVWGLGGFPHFHGYLSDRG